MSDQAHLDEVTTLLDDYVRHWYAGEWSAVAALYYVPSITMRGDGSVHCFQSLKELQAKELIFDWKLAEGHLYVARQKEHDINRASQAAALAFEQQHQFLQLTDEESSGKKRPAASS